MTSVADLTNAELHTIVRALTDYAAPDLRELRDVAAVRDKVALIIASRSRSRGFGALVFRLDLPLKVLAGKGRQRPVAPTMNEYGQMPPWMRSWLYGELDTRIMVELSKHPVALLRSSPRPRGVSVTRYSSAMPDEISVDVLGGKVPIDRLVKAGVLCGDRAKDLERRAEWKRCPPKAGHVLVEVYELE